MTDPSAHSDNDPPALAGSGRTEPPAGSGISTKPRRRPWFRLSLVGFVVVAAVLAAVVLLRENGSPAGATGAEPLNFAQVVITDLVQEDTFDGTLGSIEDDPVRTQLEGTITEIAEKGDTISQGEALFAIDDRPVVLLHGDLPAFRDIAIGEDTVTVSSQLNGTITWVAEPGTVIEQGDVLFRVDDRPVVVLYGDLPAYRNLDVAGPNPDVAAAQATLSSAKANLTALTSLPGEQQLQAAQQTLNAAQQALQDLLDLPDPVAVQIAQANLNAVQQSDTVTKNVRDREHEAAWFEAFYGEQLKKYEAGQIDKDRLDLEWNNLQAAKENLAEARAQAQLALSQAQAQYDQAQQGASPAQIANAQAQVAQAQANLNALEEGPDPDALAAAEAQVEQAQVALDALLTGVPSSGPGYDVLQLKRALAALGYDPDATMTVGNEFTTVTMEMVKAWQEDIGAQVNGVIDLGEVVFLPGPAQVLDVLASPGSQAGSVVRIAAGDPATGTDVLQLEEDLVALGFDADGTLVADGIYTPETTQAVLALQEATGLDQDGIIDLGEVIFLPDSVRITNQLTTKGSGIGTGSAVLGVSLSDKVVRVDLPADKQGVLAVGDAVTVEMPDNTLVPATVTFVSQTATPSANGPATFEVLVELDDPAAAAGLDEAPVDVIVISDSVQDVMAIPVSALVALLEGGYAVEVDAGGGHTQLVAVDVGFFGSSNMIAITSEALRPGDQVVVP